MADGCFFVLFCFPLQLKDDAIVGATDLALNKNSGDNDLVVSSSREPSAKADEISSNENRVVIMTEEPKVSQSSEPVDEANNSGDKAKTSSAIESQDATIATTSTGKSMCTKIFGR